MSELVGAGYLRPLALKSHKALRTNALTKAHGLSSSILVVSVASASCVSDLPSL